MKTTFVAAVAFGAATMLASSAFADTTPTIDDIAFSNFQTDGSACAGENMFANIVSESDAQTADILDFAFGDVAAKTGPNQKQAEFSKSCQMNFTMTYPKGYRFTFDYVSFTGFADLKQGQFGTFTTRVGGGLNKASKGYLTYLLGPITGEFQGGRTFRKITGFKTPCKGKADVAITTGVGVKGNTKAAGTIGSSKSSGYLNQSFRLVWEKC